MEFVVHHSDNEKIIIKKNAIHLSDMKVVFDINKYLPSTIASRQAIELIEANLSLKGEDKVVFNFQNTDFISRAFADELFHFIEKNNINAHFVNTGPIVKEILNTVAQNRNKRNNTFHNIAISNITKKEQLEQILSLI
jgi:anti-anti-sigma regulatory factor